MRALPARSVTLDGEAVICAPDGRSEFERMRAVFSRHSSPEAFLYAFDLLELDGRDLRGDPWDVRRAALTKLLHDSAPGIRLCEHIEDVDGAVVSAPPAPWGSKGSSPSGATAATTRDVKIKNMAHPAIERAMLIAVSKRVAGRRR